MANPPTRDNTAAKAEKYFRKAEQTETSANQIRRKERLAAAAKTEKLRGLRLAKDEADKTAQEAGGKPDGGARKRVTKVKPAPMIRMTY